MSDHEAETTEATWENDGSHSANGSDPGSIAIATDGMAGAGVDDRAKFLSDLTRVMQSTAASEAARNAETTEQRRQAHLATIRAREAAEADELRELAKIDIKDIDGWSDEEVKRIKAERERRIATRREQLQHRLEEHRGVITREIEAVEAAIGAYRVKVDDFFSRINGETDPIAIAREAGNQPQFPVLEQIGPDSLHTTSESHLPAGEELIVADAVSEVAVEAVADGGEAPDAGQNVEVSAEASGQESETGEDQPMVGVMDPDAGPGSFEIPWVASRQAAVDEAPAAPAAPEEAEALVPVEAVVGADGANGAEVAEGAEIQEGAEELTAAAADAEAEPEAHVGMPRSSGAGSWLRWPNSSSGDNNR